MMRTVIYIYCILLLSYYPALAQDVTPARPSTAATRRAKSVLMPPSEAEGLLTQCSRPVPRGHTGTWEPTAANLRAMESNFRQLTGLLRTAGAEEPDAERYHMQYAGIVIEGENLIYINAFYQSHPGEMEEWKDKAVVACDGGSRFWGALYDPKEKKFFDLHLNGKV
jgi:hypothetical protein